MTIPEQEEFCRAAWPTLVAALSHYCGDVHVAEELVQEALTRACQNWRRVGSLESPEGWTYRVAVNLANSAWRRTRAERRAYRRHGLAPGHHVEASTPDRVAVRGALASLTEPQREAVVLRYYLDLSAEQAAHVLGTTPGAVRGLTHRALRHLRAVLDTAETATEATTDVS